MSKILKGCGWIIGSLATIGNIISSFRLEDLIAGLGFGFFFGYEVFIIAISVSLIALGEILDSQERQEQMIRFLYNKMNEGTEESTDSSSVAETIDETYSEEKKESLDVIESSMVEEPKSENNMVICKYCGKSYKYNAYGCIYCHKK